MTEVKCEGCGRWTTSANRMDPGPHACSAATPAAQAPIDMVLPCPACGMQHIDAPDPDLREKARKGCGSCSGCGQSCDWPNCANVWTNPPHRSHLCHFCGHIWRPADVPTNGVAAVKTKGKADRAPSLSRLTPTCRPAMRGQGLTDERIDRAVMAYGSTLDDLRGLEAARTAFRDVLAAATPASPQAPVPAQGEDWHQPVGLTLNAAPAPSQQAEPAGWSNRAREWIDEALTYCGSPSWSPSMVREGADLLAAAPARPEAPQPSPDRLAMVEATLAEIRRHVMRVGDNPRHRITAIAAALDRLTQPLENTRE